MPYPKRHEIYEAVIRRMVIESLQAQEQQFAQEHEKDTEEQLLAYVRECAERLGHSPWPREIVGGEMILSRFESWDQVLRMANLRQPTTANKTSVFARYIDEMEQKKLIYRQKKAIKKQKAQQRLKEQAEKKQKREKAKKEQAQYTHVTDPCNPLARIRDIGSDCGNGRFLLKAV